MKNFFLSIFLFLSILNFSQSQRFYYDYQFQSDSTDLDTKKSELMVLDIDKKGSKYYSEYVYQSDSIMNAQFQRQQATKDFDTPISAGENDRGTIHYKVFKTYPNYSVIFYTSLAQQDYKVDDSRKMNWNILPDKEKIGEWNAQKATTEFAGRKWTAWFSTEIPVQDGPYKFYGLPGLIIKMQDATRTHVIELKGIKRYGQERDFNTIDLGQQFIKTDYKKLKSIYRSYWQDPVSGMRKASSEGKWEIRDDAGNKIDMTQYLKDSEKKMKEQLKKVNNILELDLIPQ